MKHLIFLLTILTTPLLAQPESYYSDVLAEKLDGITEYKVEGGRVDILTAEYAIEVKRASDWKHSIGQAIWYGLQTNKKPGIILIMKTTADFKHGQRLMSSLNYAGLDKVKVWFYPQDFGGNLTSNNFVEDQYLNRNNQLQKSNSGCTYWINTGSSKNTRHNQSCRWYNNTKKGRCSSSAYDGNACGQCGG